MAQYWEDWSGATVGATGVPSGWTARWDGAPENLEIVADADAPAGKALFVQNSANGRRVISHDLASADANNATVEIAVKFKFVASGTSTVGGPLARASGTDTSETGYVGQIFHGTDVLRILEYLNAGATIHADGTVSLTQDTTAYWMIFSVSGSTLTLTVKDATGTSTLDTISATDSSISAAGWVGLFTFTALMEFTVLAFGVGTNGDSAPLSNPSTPEYTETHGSTSAAAFGSTETYAVPGFNETHGSTSAAAAEASDTWAAGIVGSGDFPLGNIDLTTLTVDTTNPSEPILTFRPYPTGAGDLTPDYFVWWGWAAKFTGLLGKNPVIRILDEYRYNTTFYATQLTYSYNLDGPYYNTTIANGDLGAYREYQVGSNLTGDTVYFWQQVPTTPANTAATAAAVLASPYGHRLASDLAYTDDPTPGVIATIAGSTTYWGKVIPALPLYGYRISDDTASPPGGKRRAVLVGQQHAGETSSATHLRKFVEWLLTAQDGGTTNQQAAYDLLQWWEFIVYPQVNVNGNYGGASRFTFEDGDGNDPTQKNPNREWTVTTLPSIAAVKAAMALDVPSAKVNLVLDWHCRGDQDIEFFVNGTTAQHPEEVALMAAARSYSPEWKSAVTQNMHKPTSLVGWADQDFADTGYFTFCPVAAVVEVGTADSFTATEISETSIALGRGLLDRTLAGDYSALAPDHALPTLSLPIQTLVTQTTARVGCTVTF